MLPSNLTVMAEKNKIYFPTQLPLFRSAPRMEKLEEWAESQSTPMLRQIAHKIVAHLNYIPFETFLSALQETISDFNQQIAEKPYVLVLAEDRRYKLNEGCSDQWVIGLALEHGKLKHPQAILNINELDDWLKTHPSINDLLILDDASYSGKQKSEALDKLLGKLGENKARSLSVWIGIPFVNQAAKKRLNTFTSSFQELTLLCNREMPSVKSVLDERERIYGAQINIGYLSDSITLTWFDHRFPDFLSTFQHIYEGNSLISSSISSFMEFLGYSSKSLSPEEYNNIVSEQIAPNYSLNHCYYNIPQVIPPYYLHNSSKCLELKDAMEKNLLGERTPYEPQPNSVLETIMSETVIKQNHSFLPYKTTNLSLEKQEGFDKAVIEKSTYEEEQKKNIQNQLKFHNPSSKREDSEKRFEYCLVM